jgi:hypothetical protein
LKKKHIEEKEQKFDLGLVISVLLSFLILVLILNWWFSAST